MRPIPFMIVMLSISTVSLSQTPSAVDRGPGAVESGFFQRKSISVLPVLMHDASSYRKYAPVMMFQTHVEIAKNNRFDYNFVSEAAMDCFLQKSARLTHGPELIGEISTLIRSCGVLEEIVISSTNSDSLAARIYRMKKREQVSAAGIKNLDTKPTAEQLLNLLNGTYIGVPVIQRLTSGADAYATGNIIWYQLQAPPLHQWPGSAPLVSDVELLEVNARKLDTKQTLSLDVASDDPGDIKAVKKSVIELFNAANSMEAFKIRAVLQQVADGVKVDLGDREGVYLDQGYKVFEQRLDANNKPYSKFIGFVRIDNIGKTSTKIDALSSVYPIIPGSFERGMSAVSHDQLFDVSIRPGLSVTNVPAQSINWLPQLLLVNPDAKLISEDATLAFGAHLAGLYNVARYTGVNQLFVGVDIGVGVLNTTTISSTNAGDPSFDFTIGTPLLLEGSISVLKKFWFSRIAAQVELQAGVNTLMISGTLLGGDWSMNYGYTPAVGARAGLSYAITPDLSAGVSGAFRYVFPVSSLTVTSTSGSETEYLMSDNEAFWQANELNDINFGGISIGFDITYSIPSF